MCVCVVSARARMCASACVYACVCVCVCVLFVSIFERKQTTCSFFLCLVNILNSLLLQKMWDFVSRNNNNAVQKHLEYIYICAVNVDSTSATL